MCVLYNQIYRPTRENVITVRVVSTNSVCVMYECIYGQGKGRTGLQYTYAIHSNIHSYMISVQFTSYFYISRYQSH